ncbi:MAG: hypothetical protein A2951_00780 [Candidatus Buchananbacteria bacterium RIFCSPLOWO2_01_FULL_56_15]|uniref:EamA domain-containing protein n=2 Tax=Candidatus Buchananiibacteriota TaxID=1817903 RepID=A0A1G1YG10_9BACT|nr:MAG: hypothetical protein A3J59_02840 [Candidatus Buchananbacteria bacterium RIFCSPHIGHO2_02_FULL_56_16]OGY54967.1 MAG: hypothetical protein A2951_00780 [Candidatus Buchananbacteria bacterium RIFCSPLOWO2_01_FULL_56_15]
MFGVILVTIGTFFQEISDSIGKYKVENQEESPFAMGFLSLFWGTILFALISLVNRDAFVFSLNSLPTFSVRLILEIVQLYVTVFAIIKADRTTFNFVRTITIPLLLLADLTLGYHIGFPARVGMSVIVFTLLVLFSTRSIKKEGIGLVAFTAVNAVITLSLFKYDITHFNSVAAEQLLIYFVLLVCFFILATFRAKENLFVFLTKPIFLLQSASTGFGGVIESFGFNFGAASVMVAAKRSSAIFWSLIAGKTFFREKHMVFKFLVFFVLLIGLVLLAIN